MIKKKKISSGKRTLLQRGKKTTLQMLVACGFLMGAGMMQSCDKDNILTGQPDWLGNSIYESLQEGIDVNGQHQTFNTTIKLLDELGYHDELSATGSMTLFVSTDEAYNQWFQNNAWGVKSYEELTIEQKKQLFNSTILNNSYLLNMLSSDKAESETKDPEVGKTMRRATQASIWDNIPVMRKENFPKNELITDDPVNLAWGYLNEHGDSVIHIMKDNTNAPMIHFLPEFMRRNNITDNDLYIISNHESNSVNDSWINGKKIVSEGLTCKNGYIYVVDGVMSTAPNMAQIIHETENTKTWAHILDRWSVPMRMNTAYQNEFWRLYPQFQGDTLYTLRYLNSSGNNRIVSPTGFANDSIGEKGLLKFDPGWNQYIANNNQITMQNDAGVMLVPTDVAFKEWYENGAGKPLHDKFGDIDNVPYTTLAPLINVNMVESFVGSVPSKFNSIYDDTQISLGVTPDKIEKCIMGCNGVVYITSKVYEPAEYSSILFPATVEAEGTFSIMYRALTGNYTKEQNTSMDFSPYIMAKDSRFSMFIPYNVYESSDVKSGLVLRMIDPCSFGFTTQNLLEIYLDKSELKGYAYPCTVADDGTVTLTGAAKKTVSAAVVANRLYDLIDNSIIIHSESGKEKIDGSQQYYKTKAGSVIKAVLEGDATVVQGGFQLHTGDTVKILKSCTYPQGNGHTYGVESDSKQDRTRISLPMTSVKSVCNVLRSMKNANNGYTLFFDLIYNDESKDKNNKSTSLAKTADGGSYCLAASVTGANRNMNLTLFDNYNYTVYVPSDEEIQKLIDEGSLPTWNDYKNARTQEEKDKIADIIHSFVRYHVQDNAIYIGGEKVNNQVYESSKLNTVNNKFYAISVTQDGSNLTVKDAAGQTHKVLTDEGDYNIACREYWLDKNASAATSHTSSINASSNIVVHKIDGVMLFDKDKQHEPWNTSSAKRYSARR